MNHVVGGYQNLKRKPWPEKPDELEKGRLSWKETHSVKIFFPLTDSQNILTVGLEIKLKLSP